MSLFGRPFHSRVRRQRSAFSLVELLVVIAIITVLISLLLPAVQSARAAARRTQCKSHLHQIGIALHSYHDSHNTLPPGSIVMGPSFPVQSGWGWVTFILPQLEQSPLHQQIEFAVANAQPVNRALIATTLPIHRCPSDSAPQTIATSLPGGGTAFVAHGNYPGSEEMFFPISSVRLKRVSDGLSQTLMVGESTYFINSVGQHTSAWCGIVSDGTGYQFSASLPYLAVSPSTPVNSSSSFNSRHMGGAHFLMGDGSVQFLGEATDWNVYRALFTINGNEVVKNPF